MELSRLYTKDEYLHLFKIINEPLRQHYVGKSRIMFGSTGVGYGNKIAGIEGFARMLWGAGPAIEKLDGSWQEEIRVAIVNGTDVNSKDYWGDLHDRDQRMVEMPAIAFALFHNDSYLWNKFTKSEQKQIATWLKQIFDHECSNGNWQFFKVLVYQILIHLGVKVDDTDAKNALEKIEHCYRKDGWYQDSDRGREDYYTPFAFQYYGILYSTLVPDSEQSEVFRKRAKEFAQQFINFFDEEGSNIPFGRSLTYRYAAVAFWVAMVYGNIWPEKTGVIKGIINRNIRWWFKHPIFDESNLLTLGYGYSQLSMTEPYNSPVSPYWSNKIFLLLALPQNHPYWKTEEEKLPDLKNIVSMPSPHLLAYHDNGHAIILNAGQSGPNYHALTNEKYFKFAYSSKFGFSIPRSNQLKEEAVMDSMIGLQTLDTTMTANRKGKNIVEPGMFYTRNNIDELVQTPEYVASTWKINEELQVRTWLIPFDGWQIRIHHLLTEKPTLAYETGFAIENSPDNSGEIINEDNGNYFKGPKGFSGIVNLSSNLKQKNKMIGGFPNTNLMTSEVVALPGIETTLSKGIYWLMTGIYAHQDVDYALNKWNSKPIAKLTNHRINLELGNKKLSMELR